MKNKLCKLNGEENFISRTARRNFLYPTSSSSTFPCFGTFFVVILKNYHGREIFLCFLLVFLLACSSLFYLSFVKQALQQQEPLASFPTLQIDHTPFPCPSFYTKTRHLLHRHIVDKFLRGHHSSGSQPRLWLLAGGPGSGKSTIVNQLLTNYERGVSQFEFLNMQSMHSNGIASTMGGQNQKVMHNPMLYVDPDDILKELPEYVQSLSFWHEELKAYVLARDAAFACHDEAFYIAGQLANEAVRRGIDFVYHGTGRNISTYRSLISETKKSGYSVHLLLTYCPLAMARKRVHERGMQTGRFVPDEKVTEIYSVVYKNFVSIYRLCDKAFVYNTSNYDSSVGDSKPRLTWQWNASDSQTYCYDWTKNEANLIPSSPSSAIQTKLRDDKIIFEFDGLILPCNNWKKIK